MLQLSSTIAEPYYWRTIAKQQYEGLRFSCINVSSIFQVNKTMRRHEIVSYDWHISWYCLLNVPIKLHPVTLMKYVFIDGRMFQVKTQLPLRIRLQISKYME